AVTGGVFALFWLAPGGRGGVCLVAGVYLLAERRIRRRPWGEFGFDIRGSSSAVQNGAPRTGAHPGWPRQTSRSLTRGPAQGSETARGCKLFRHRRHLGGHQPGAPNLVLPEKPGDPRADGGADRPSAVACSGDGGGRAARSTHVQRAALQLLPGHERG